MDITLFVVVAVPVAILVIGLVADLAKLVKSNSTEESGEARWKRFGWLTAGSGVAATAWILVAVVLILPR